MSPRPATTDVELISLPLGVPPKVVALSVGVQGVSRRIERWLLPDLYSLHLYEYRGELGVGGRTYPIQPGAVSVVPPGRLMAYRLEGRSQHIYAHLALSDSPADADVREVPVIQDARGAAQSLAERLRGAISLENPLRRSAEMWAVLCWIADLPGVRGAESTSHPAVSAAIAFIDAHLTERLTVTSIADTVGFSPSHLDRLFLAATERTVGSFVRDRRMSMARHLLTETTTPIPSIAASVGLPDLQVFNKACRRTFGTSPRGLRGQPLSISRH